MTNITFKTNHAKAMITTNNLVNFDLKDLVIDSNGSFEEDKNINSLLLDYFIENRDIENLYISKRKNNTHTIGCNYMVSLSGSYNLDIIPFTLVNNTCRHSSPTYIVYNLDIPDLSPISCIENTGNGPLPACFYFTGYYDRSIKDSTFIGNKNYHISGNGAIQIESENNLYVRNCSFLDNSADFAPAIYFKGKNLYVDSSKFESNESKLGSGGAIYFILGSANNKGAIIISSSSFRNNSAQTNGGGIYIEAKSTVPLGLDLIISQTNFTENYADYGSALYLDRSVSLSQSSTIITSKFKENNSHKSGTIALYFYSGILSFKSCEFSENSSNFGAVFHIDINDDTDELHSKAIIELSTFRNNTGSSIINLDNQNRNSTVVTKNCLFEFNKGIIASLNFDYFSDSGSVFQYNLLVLGPAFSFRTQLFYMLVHNFLIIQAKNMVEL
ncbi:unnamed protein product [Blepharisma stoltei]|uniref:Uncharacterized protein n=1 Tax=Blepharisma stoltei TaxID=1481888 RepID=A0AAU9IN48_9CILI|nr:unnamed protein product [Blepharisma stoltei]